MLILALMKTEVSGDMTLCRLVNSYTVQEESSWTKKTLKMEAAGFPRTSISGQHVIFQWASVLESRATELLEFTGNL
jgi:hypothetical protein